MWIVGTARGRQHARLGRWEKALAKGRRAFLVRGTLVKAAIFSPVVLSSHAWMVYSGELPAPSPVRAVIMVAYFVLAGLFLGYFASRIEWRTMEADEASRLHGDTPAEYAARQRTATGRPSMIFCLIAALAMGTLALAVAWHFGEVWMWLWGATCFAGVVYFATELVKFRSGPDA